MKNTIFILVLLSSIQMSGCASDDNDSVDYWSEFIGTPSLTNARTLTQNLTGKVSKCGWGAPENEVAVPERIRPALFGHIGNGNTPSLKVGFYVEKCLDGGDLGDFHRSAGQHFDANPEEFLREVAASEVATETYTSMLVMLPLAIVDDVDSQVELVRSRIQKLNTIGGSIQTELKLVGLRALGDQEIALTE